jgi:hypothetical protein
MAWLRYERLSPRLRTSKKPLRWAAPLLKLPGVIVIAAAGIAIVVLAAAISWWLLVPAADWLAHHDVGSAKGPLLQTARDAARGRLLTLGAGLFAAGALIYTARTFGLSREGQVTDRYTKAIEQLGSDKLDVRIGGIYALERVARDSAKDHPTVMEVLTAFVREHSREQWPLPEHDTDPAPPPERRPDVQAALTVIGRRHASRDTRPIDLARADLTGANLAGALLFHADLTGAHLAYADLAYADLAAARLARADLTGAHPWSQLLNEALRLQILIEQGHADQVLAEVTRLQQQMTELPELSEQPEPANPYNVHENILYTAHSAASQLRRWEDALAFSAQIMESEKRRGASVLDRADTRFNAYGPLLRLGRIADARSLLLECREIYEREHHTAGLGKVLSALADVENEAGHGQDAIDLERNALRYKYLVGEINAIVVSHHNLGSSLAQHDADHRQALAHHLASALLLTLTGIEGTEGSLRATARDLAQVPAGAAVPASVEMLCTMVGEVPGVHLDRLLAQLTDNLAAAQGALDTLIARARVLADPNVRLARHLAAWDPVIAGITAATSGDDDARAAVERGA